ADDRVAAGRVGDGGGVARATPANGALARDAETRAGGVDGDGERGRGAGVVAVGRHVDVNDAGGESGEGHHARGQDNCARSGIQGVRDRAAAGGGADDRVTAGRVGDGGGVARTTPANGALARDAETRAGGVDGDGERGRGAGVVAVGRHVDVNDAGGESGEGHHARGQDNRARSGI